MGIRSELAMLDGEKEMMLQLEQFTSLSFFFFTALNKSYMTWSFTFVGSFLRRKSLETTAKHSENLLPILAP